MTADALAVGTVSEWFPEEGWGVLVSPEVDGTVFAHFSMIRDQTGWRGLEPGQRVAFTWAPGGQDGCDLRAVDVYSSGERTVVREPTVVEAGDQAAYSSTLSIDFGDGPERVS